MLNRKAKVFRPTAFAIPYIVLTVVFVVVPLFLVLLYALRGDDGSFTFENFKYVFTDEGNIEKLWQTIRLAAISTAICLLIAYPTAFVLASKPFNKMAILALLFIIPMWINFMLRIFALQSLLTVIGIGNGDVAAVIGIVYDFFPYVLLPIYTVLSNMDKSYLEASRDLGASNIGTFFRVTLPLSIPGVVSGVSMMFMPVFSAYSITKMMGSMETTVIGAKIATLFEYHDYGYGSALAFVLLVIVLIVLLIGTAITKATSKAPQGGKS